MFLHTLFTACRHIWRNKLLSLINIMSLFIGLSVFLLAFLYVKRETTYNQSWPEADRIHRLIVRASRVPGLRDGEQTSIEPSNYELLKDYFADELEDISRYKSSTMLIEGQERSYPASIIWFVDKAFANIFELDVVAGNIQTALDEPGKVAISENFASKFPEAVKLGEMVNLQGFGGAVMPFEVAAIYRLPEHTSRHMNFSALGLIDEASSPFFSGVDGGMGLANWSHSVDLWVKLKASVSSKTFNEYQSGFVDHALTAFSDLLSEDEILSNRLVYEWQPVDEMYLHPMVVEAMDGVAGDAGRVLTFGMVGVLVLLAGCLNSVSLSLSVILSRQQEVGIRKAAGAYKQDIIIQYLGESLILGLLSLLLVFALLEIGGDAIYQLAPAVFSNKAISLSLPDYGLLIFITLFIAMINGLYPALVLSAYQPQTMFKPRTTTRFGMLFDLRSLLVLLQFSFSAILLIGTAALYAQLVYVRSQSQGFSVENQLVITADVRSFMDGGVNTGVISNALQSIPGVKSVITANSVPGLGQSLSRNDVDVRLEGDFSAEIKASGVMVSPDFFVHYQVPVLAGREFQQGRDVMAGDEGAYTDSEGSWWEGRRILLNRQAVSALGFASPEDALQQQVFLYIPTISTEQEVPAIIIGVVEDSMLHSFKYAAGAHIYQSYYSPRTYRVALEYDESVESSIQQRASDAWNKAIGVPPADFIFLEERLKTAFSDEQNESFLLLICAGMAMFLSCIGLFGLAHYRMGRNVKEVGIRKVLGSDISAMMQLFLWRFSKPIILANIIAAPIAVYFVLQWIEQFPYQLEKIWLFPIALGTAAAVLLVSLLTVGWITWRAASERPVRALRYE